MNILFFLKPKAEVAFVYDYHTLRQAMEAHEIPANTNTVVQRLINMENLEVLSHCLLLDDVWIEDNLIGAKMYTIFKLGISSQSTAFLL